ncbi:patatin-like phospholipase family protein [Phenylobacterium aquaticum]|uniref:patatin-like phospholipase family protein n=1 Tax=Phenylobacterium aquaticum TaxID=1763816 RepID=UPI0026F21D5C|nr:patatin-like phospholipase family protein [Phenylobacterium aquaticum]
MRFTAFAALGCALMLSACGTINRDLFTEHDLAAASPEGLSDLRFNANDRAAGLRFSNTVSARANSGKPFNALAISGGGANGAYAAGFLAGWTAQGDRPEFDVVSGVSTGALTAPLAFLGPAYDDRMRDAYLSGKAARIVSRETAAALTLPGLFRSDALRELVEAYVDPPLLAAIAAEHRKGRRLLVATTNLDTEETVIWDMGAIAQGGDGKALKLFQDVLVASASIPGVFPPALIQVQGQGRALSEMHADGGVTTPFFIVPETLLLWTAPQSRAAAESTPAHIYVLINGQIGASFGFTKGDSLSILARSYDALSKAQARTQLAASQAFAERNHAALMYSAIPNDVEADSLNFKPANMKRLYAFGFARGRAAGEWETGVTPPAPAPTAPR